MRSLKALKETDYLALAGSLLLIIALKPYILWNAPSIIDVGIKFVAVIIFFLSVSVNKGKDILLFTAFFIILFFQGIIRGAGLLDWLFIILPVSCIPFMKTRFGSKCYRYFELLFATLLLISLLVWTGVLLGGSFPFKIIEPLNSIKEYNYMVYPFLLVPLKTNIIQDIRFAGPFDEPGVIGTITLIMLYINGFSLRKWFNLVFIIAGICSFSLFFYFGALLYAGFMLLKRNKYAIFIFAFFIGGFYLATKDNEIFDELIYSRIEWDSDEGSFSGDNRSKHGEKQYLDEIRWSEAYFWGSGPTISRRFEGSWGFRNVIILYGAVFVALYCLFFLVLAYSKKLSIKSFLLFSILFFSVIYQRPDLFETTKVFLFSYMISYLGINERVIVYNKQRKAYAYSE